MRLYEKITAGKVKYPAHLMSDAKDLLKNLLTTDLTKRYGNLANGSRDVFAHTWLYVASRVLRWTADKHS
jgi:protein kinase A